MLRNHPQVAQAPQMKGRHGHVTALGKISLEAGPEQKLRMSFQNAEYT